MLKTCKRTVKTFPWSSCDDKNKDMEQRSNKFKRKISDTDKINSFIWQNSRQSFVYCQTRHAICAVSGHFKNQSLSIYCLSVLMRGIWKKHRIKVDGWIDGVMYELIDDYIIEKDD